MEFYYEFLIEILMDFFEFFIEIFNFYEFNWELNMSKIVFLFKLGDFIFVINLRLILFFDYVYKVYVKLLVI